jgi:hypothetical protein
VQPSDQVTSSRISVFLSLDVASQRALGTRRWSSALAALVGAWASAVDFGPTVSVFIPLGAGLMGSHRYSAGSTFF